MTWVPGAEGSAFGVDNLPYGVFSTGDRPPRAGVRIGDHVLAGAVADPELDAPSLNPFLAKGPEAWRAARDRLRELLTAEDGRAAAGQHLFPLSEATLHMPFDVGDYVDFYASLEHASNLGRMFRPDEEPLKPNWRHLPVGYHGRSGTVVPSGTPIRRPRGQRVLSRPASPSAAAPSYGPSARLDIEAELGFVVGAPSAIGAPVPVERFADHVFGVTLVNDWSARDIQAWEYVPLGPFLGKSFATSISPWITPLAALEHARVPGRAQDPAPLGYLARREPWGLDLDVTIELNGEVVSRPPYAGMYWTPDQMLAHMTVNGASLRTGDLYASGTISGADPDRRGSLIEISWNGTSPLKLADGSTRAFLEDRDTVTIAATAPGPGGTRLALGEVTGTIIP